MWILYLALIVCALAAGYAGSHSWFRFERLNKQNVLNGTLIVLILFTVLMMMYAGGYFPQSVAAPFMMVLYSLLAGFFLGYASRLYQNRRRSGTVLYQYRSFWVDHAPNLLAVVLILFGLYRTAIITDQLITGIRITSGISLISFGLFTWTLKAVPEFRSEGIIILDRLVAWDEVVAWHWISEEVVAIEYLAVDSDEKDRIKEFTTKIPDSDRKELDMILNSKMEEYHEERKEKLLGEH